MTEHDWKSHTDNMMPGYSRRQFLTRAGAVAGAVSLGGLLQACGGTDAAETTGGSGATQTASGTSIASANAAIEKYSQVPAFVPPGPSFDARTAAAGKTLYFIPVLSAVPFVQVIAESLVEIGKELDVKVVDWVNKATPQEWIQGMDTARAEGADAVELLQIDPAKFAPQVAQLKDAGIQVNESLNRTVPGEKAPNVDSSIPNPSILMGKLMADYIVGKTNGDAHALLLTINELLNAPGYGQGFTKELDSLCSGCKTTTINFALADVASRTQPQVQTALVGDSSINYVVPIYDELFIPNVHAAIATAGVGDRVKIVSADASPPSLKSLQEGDEVEMDVGFGINWAAYAIMDQHLRMFAGLDPVDDPHIGVRVFTDDNVDEAGVPPTFEQGFGDTYQQGYRELWQLS